MKTKNILLPVIAGMMVLSLGGCKKFIKEELVTTLTEDYYKTDAGLENLVKSAYEPLKWKFESEQAYCLWNFGLDEFRVGDQFNNVQYNYYNTNLNSNSPDGFMNALWSTYYAGIHRCNLGIKLITAFNDPTSKVLGTEASKNVRIAELKGLRGFFYFTLVQQFGGVPLITVPPDEVQTEFPRKAVGEVYNQVISDLKESGPVLEWRNNTERGRFTRATAYHFLAKAFLTRGSAVTEDRGQQGNDLDNAILYADSVIKFSGHALEADFASLFNAAYAKHIVPRAGTDGTPPVASLADINSNNASNEIIFAAQFTQNLALSIAAGGNQTHLYYITQYDGGVAIPGMTRDFFNGRPFRRLRPTDYTVDVFDWKNDSRFFKTFQTVYYRNVPSNSGLPTFTAADAPTPDVIGKPKVGIGDTAAFFIVNKPENALLTSEIDKYRYYRTYARYKKTSPSAAPISDWNENKYLSMIKFLDGVRLTQTNNEARGIRNGTLARLAETYLIVAEAYGRKADYGNALLYINALRNRAAYKAGEKKNPHFWMYYGGAVNDLNATTAQMQATADLWTTNAASEQYPPSANSTDKRFIHFMLNEKTREMCGELFRWEDLARTETFYERTKLFNADAQGVQPIHKLRPIPLPQIISQTKNGQPLSQTDIANYQNPGY